jgi:protein-S-isoprenylcysteine O-methyltransferase Ste14
MNWNVECLSSPGDDMNKKAVEPATAPTKPISPLVVVQFLVYALLPPALLLVLSGDYGWRMAWINIGLNFVFIFGSRLFLLFTNPGVLLERAKSISAKDAKRWDKPLLLFTGLITPLLLVIICGLDHRWMWSGIIPPAWQWVGLSLYTLGGILAIWAMLVNAFFSAAVRIQADRGHSVIQNGPYRIVRHPSYIGGILGYLATPVMLNALWALIPAGLAAVIIILRTRREDLTLQEELPGYRAYTQRTRYRLLPGIW